MCVGDILTHLQPGSVQGLGRCQYQKLSIGFGFSNSRIFQITALISGYIDLNIFKSLDL